MKFEKVPASASPNILDTQLRLHVETGALITADWHIPHHDADWASFAFTLAKEWGITTHILNGDVLDLAHLSTFSRQIHAQQREPTLDEELAYAESVLSTSARSFLTYMNMGNHEWRFYRRLLNASLSAERFLRLFTIDSITLTALSYIILNDHIRITHPRNYSQVRTAVASRLAEKYHQDIVMGHSHNIGYTRDRSGKFICIDSGAMLIESHLDYLTSVDASNPRVNRGFVIYTPEGRLLLFDAENCDQEFWLWKARRRTSSDTWAQRGRR